jgi:hypothetical protein
LLVKKFNKDKQGWLEYIMYLFRRHQTEQAKTILDKSFSSLPSTDRMKKKILFSKIFFQ